MAEKRSRAQPARQRAPRNAAPAAADALIRSTAVQGASEAEERRTTMPPSQTQQKKR